MKRFGFIVIVLVFSLGLITTGPSAIAKEKSVKYLKIGCNYGLTGLAASIGIPVKRSMELEVERINSKGGIMVRGQRYLIKPIFEDNGYTSEGSVTAATKLIDRENVKFMFTIGTPGLAQTSITEPSKVLSFLSSSADQALLNKRYSIRVYPLIQMNNIALLEYITENIPEIKRICLLFKNDSSGILNSKVLPKLCKHFGLQFIGYELYSLRETDFYPLLTRMLRRKPDLIVTDVGKPGALMAMQALEKGYKGYFMGTTLGADVAWHIVGNKIPDGRWLGPIVDPGSDAAPLAIQKMKRRYEEKYGKGDPLDICYLYYNYLMLVIQAVQKAGTVDDTDKIRDVIVNNAWDLPWGKTTFGGKKIWGVDGQGIMPVFVSKWMGSQKKIKLLKVIPADDVYPIFLKLFGKK